MRSKYSIGEITLIQDDCLSALLDIPDNSVDCIITDPPYDLQIHGGSKNNDFGKRALVKDKHIEFISNGFDTEKVFAQFERICKTVNCLIFCSNAQISNTMSYWENRGYSTTLLVWDKPNPIPLSGGKYISNLEFIVYVRGINCTFNYLGYNKGLKTFRYPAPQQRIHPTEKPIDLLRQLILTHSNENDTILDCFAGSFSTAHASLLENRKFIGIEILNEYYELGVKRIMNESQQGKLF